MLTFLYVLFTLSLVALVATLIMGGRALTRPGDKDRQASNKWMWRRIYAQGAAFGLLILILLAKRNGG